MRRTSIVLAAIALAGCAASGTPPSGTATVTLFGPGTELGSWQTVAVENTHLHSADGGRPCPSEELLRSAAAAMEALPAGRPDQLKNATRSLQAAGESTCRLTQATVYGGRGRTALFLRPAGADQALIVDLPQLQPQESDRLSRSPELLATLERPLGTVEAVLERGWVRAVRAPGGRLGYELFLVLKPARPGASYESIQVITRVEPPGR